MSGRRIWWLVKFFGQEEHANQFMKGGLHLNRLSFFKRIEGDGDGLRGDSNEGVWAWFQPDDLVINLTVLGIGAVEITKKDLAGPVSFGFAEHDDVHVFCMYAIHTPTYDVREDGKIELSPEQVNELEACLRIDERCQEFGRFAVIVRANPFLARLKDALKARGRWFRGQLVEYYDDETFHGEFPARDAPFRKQKRFAYQQEFRVCIRTGTHGDDPMRVEMGDIRDIAAKVEAQRLNGMFQLNLEPMAEPT